MNLSCQPLLDRVTHIANKCGFTEKFHKITILNLQQKIELCLSNDNLNYKENNDFNINKEITSLLSVLYTACEKNEKSLVLAEELKAKGSQAYIRKKDIDAFNFYSDGLRHTPANSNIIPILYSNRSACLFQLKRYKECLTDIQRAEDNGYPVTSQYKKLLERKFECYQRLGLKNEAYSSLQRLRNIEASSLSTLITDKNKNFFETLKEQIENMSIKEDNSDEAPLDQELFLSQNETVKGMTSAFDIRLNDVVGRHVVAMQDVPKGSVVFKEKPFASILLPEYFLSYCQGCFSPVFNPIYCDDCCNIVWCSEDCKESGQKFHRYECHILHIVTGVGIAHLALRIVLMAGWNTCAKVRKDVSSSRELYRLTEVFKGADLETKYKAVFSLLTHFDKAVPEDQLQYALAAIILSKSVLDKSDFFEDQMSADDDIQTTDEAVVALASVVMHHIAQLISNAHAITQVREAPQGQDSCDVCSVEQSRIASAIYSSASLMNHSCLPSIINSFCKNELIIYCIEDIKCGEEVYNCYGPHANREEREERQSSLNRQYFFNCKCESCTDDKFLIKEISWSGLTCEKCGGVSSWKEGTRFNETGFINCSECKRVSTPSESILQKCSTTNQLFQEGENSFDLGDFGLAEKKFSEALTIGSTTYTKQNQFLNSIRDALAKTLASVGNYEEASLVLSTCMKMVASRYGERSVEMAHELVKYSDLLKLLPDHNPKKNKISSINEKIHSIFEIHYGPQWRSYLKIKE